MTAALRMRLHNPGRWWTAARRGRAGAVQLQWPPSPWTVLSALVAAAHAGQDPDPVRAVVDRLASCGDPSMWLPPIHEHTVPAVYVGKTGPYGAEQHWNLLDASRAVAGKTDERTKHRWRTARGEWGHSCVFVDFPLELTDAELAVLAQAARRVPYVGRATDTVTLGVITLGEAGPVDHTAPDGAADDELLRPGPQHRLWEPVPQRGAPVRCASPDLLHVLDTCHDRRHRQGLPGVPDSAKGRTVGYAPRDADPHTVENSDRVALLLAGRRTAADVLTTLGAGEAERVPLLLGGATPWAVSFPDREQAAAAAAAQPGLFRDGQPVPRHVARYYGSPHARWRTVSPVVAHPHRAIADAAITTELTQLGVADPQIELQPAGPCPELPHLNRWQVTVTTPIPHPGPIRAGAGLSAGYGRFGTA